MDPLALHRLTPELRSVQEGRSNLKIYGRALPSQEHHLLLGLRAAVQIPRFLSAELRHPEFESEPLRQPVLRHLPLQFPEIAAIYHRDLCHEPTRQLRPLPRSRKVNDLDQFLQA